MQPEELRKKRPEKFTTTRTEAFCQWFRENRPNEDLNKLLRRLAQFPESDTLTGWFVHEANNAFGLFTIDPETGKPFYDPPIEEYPEIFQEIVNVERSMDWFVKTGPLKKEEVMAFIKKVKAVRKWDYETVQRLREEFENLCKLAENRVLESKE